MKREDILVQISMFEGKPRYKESPFQYGFKPINIRWIRIVSQSYRKIMYSIELPDNNL